MVSASLSKMDSSSTTERFDERFLKLYTELTATYLALVWEDELAKYSPADWLEIVKSYTLPEVTELLGREEPPNFDELIALPWIDTDDAGTYLHLLSPETTGHHNHLYSGAEKEYTTIDMDRATTEALHYNVESGIEGGSRGLRARRERRE